jgi:hypothetical protein
MRRIGADAAERVVRLDGVFDVPAARRLEQVLERARDGESIRVDLTQVREFHDFGIAILAQALKHGARRVALQGLRHHQVTMLRYFGADPSRFELPKGQPEIG